ncbi:uncharacterized protein LOC123566172 isoform X2 [Mercenaria mercenaria]|uniref:uncharacterized protein LOC123566172 isoform X2 n=1 Tax=Mercenaria mercenaria TaxID=6596 RepID=UPI00234EB816|nr:uncharacterized protein LOC123566172 isoform X2 [Mercenaria mercenaria]
MDKNYPGKPMTIYDIPGILRITLPKAATPLNIIRGFEVSGIVPYNPDVFTDFDFAPSYVIDRPETKSMQNENGEYDVTEKHVVTSTPVNKAQDTHSNRPENETLEVHDGAENEEALRNSAFDLTYTEWERIRQHIEKENLGLENVPGDGHCLLYAVQASLKSGNIANFSIEEIGNKLTEEVNTYSQFYNKFTVEGQNIETELERYIIHKEYSNNTGDLVLSALNSAL